MQSETRGKSPCRGVKKLGELRRELGQLGRVERCDVGQKHGPVGEVLCHSGVTSAAAGDGLESEIGLLLEEVERRLELVVDEEELGYVAFRVALHLGLESRKAHLLGAPTRGREWLRREVVGSTSHCFS